MRRFARGGIALLLVLCCAGLAPAEPKKRGRDAREEDRPARVEARLTVSPRHGFRPLTFTLTGHLLGVSPDDQAYCHLGVEWEARTPSGLTSVSKEDARCLHPPEEVDVALAFTKVVTLSQPGIYVYRLILHRRDGETLASNTQEVRVLDN